MKKDEVCAVERLKAIVFLLNQDEVDAITGYSSMTQQTFDRIMEKCEGQGVNDFLCEIMARYPEFLLDNVKRLELENNYEYGLSEDDANKVIYDSDGLWDNLCRIIEEIE